MAVRVLVVDLLRRRLPGGGRLRGLTAGAALGLFLLVAAVGCARSPVEQAASGKFEPEKNNKIITSYCTSCHTHKDFQADPHVARVATLYTKPPYQGATECRTCHRIKLKGWAIRWVERKTHRPHGRMTPISERATPPAPPATK